MGNRGVENDAEALPVDDAHLRAGRGLVALRWGAAFGVVGAMALMALIFVLAVFLGALVDLMSSVSGRELGGELDRWTLVRDTAVGPLTCIAVSSGLAWVIGRSPGTTIPAWGVGLMSGLVGVLAGYAALHFAVF